MRAVFEVAAEGWSKSEIARRTGVSRAQVRDWLTTDLSTVLASPMRVRSAKEPHDASACDAGLQVPIGPYAYLLGQYLGDGCISELERGHPRLRISTCDWYPDIRAECIAAIEAVQPGVGTTVIQRSAVSTESSGRRAEACLGRDSNPHCAGFESASSASWDTEAGTGSVTSASCSGSGCGDSSRSACWLPRWLHSAIGG